MSKLHLVASVANMFAAAHTLPADGDAAQPARPPDGAFTLSIEGVEAMLDIPREDAITVLVELRTFLHNRFLVPRAKCNPATAARLFGSDVALKAEAAAMLADILDDIDEVNMRLDLRVVEGVAEQVPLDDFVQRDRAVVELANTMTLHEAAWFALRPDTYPPLRHQFMGYEPSMAQLQLPLDAAAASDASSTNVAVMGTATSGSRGARATRRFVGPKAAPLVLGSARTAAAHVSCPLGLDDYLGPRQVTPGDRPRSTGRREGALLGRQ